MNITKLTIFGGVLDVWGVETRCTETIKAKIPLETTVSHLSQALPAAACFGLYDYHLPAVPVVRSPLPIINGRAKVPDDCAPGLSVSVNEEILGDPVMEFAL